MGRVFWTRITSLPGSGGTPRNSSAAAPRWKPSRTATVGLLVAGIRRDEAYVENAVSSSCGGPGRAVAGLQKKRGPKTAGVAGRRVRAPGVGETALRCGARGVRVVKPRDRLVVVGSRHRLHIRIEMARLLGIHIKNYRSLDDVELGQVDYGKGIPLPQLVCLIGPNGSGKSTVLDAFGFVADCLLDGVEAACDRPWRGGFARIRTQGSTDPISFEIFFEHDDPKRPMVYELVVDEKDGIPFAAKETCRQRRVGQQRGKPYYFLKLAKGAGKVWAGDELGEAKDTKVSKAVKLASLDTLGISTLGNLSEHPRIVALRAYIEQWYLSYFVPDAARTLPAAGAQRWLNKEGGNIGNVLQYYQRQFPKEFSGIMERLASSIPGLKKITPKPSEDNRLLLEFDEQGYKDPFFQQSMSDGTLKMLAYAVLLEDPAPRPFIGIEEPENGLYMRLVERLASHFSERTSRAKNATQMLVTTHSPYFVDALLPEQVWVIKKDAKGRSNAVRAADVKIVKTMADKGMPLGSLWYSNHFDDGMPVEGAGVLLEAQGLEVDYVLERTESKRKRPSIRKPLKAKTE